MDLISLIIGRSPPKSHLQSRRFRESQSDILARESGFSATYFSLTHQRALQSRLLYTYGSLRGLSQNVTYCMVRTPCIWPGNANALLYLHVWRSVWVYDLASWWPGNATSLLYNTTSYSDNPKSYCTTLWLSTVSARSVCSGQGKGTTKRGYILAEGCVMKQIKLFQKYGSLRHYGKYEFRKKTTNVDDVLNIA